MDSLEQLVRQNILALKPYSSARDEFSETKGVFLDANENPYGTLNRYPDPYQQALKLELAKLKNVPVNQIFIGNGSDEIIDLCFRIFCNPGKDCVLTFSPTYGMYAVSAAINDVDLFEVPLNLSFQIDLNTVKNHLENIHLKLVFVCSPNNPTGNCIHKNDIEELLNAFNGIVFIDEAYIDFSNQSSCIELLNKYPNLIISQTFSKARALAAARIGIAYASESIIKLFNKVKPPYNVSTINQEAALKSLLNAADFKSNLKKIIAEKEQLKEKLSSLDLVKKIYPSDANFFLIEVGDAPTIYNTLVEQKIIIRNRNSLVKNCLRITVGTPSENNKLIEAIEKIKPV